MNLPFDAKNTARECIEFIQQTVKNAGFSKAIVAVSGGIDSATSLTLAAKALGPENVVALLLPYGTLNDKGVEDGKLVCATSGILNQNIQTIDITPFVEPFLNRDTNMDKIRKGNLMARTRMMILFDEAKKREALVIGTENKSEHYLGYFTRFGDEASDLEPLRALYKTEVYELANYLEVPKPILTKAPTAGLWEGQTDEGELGVTYGEIDQILTVLIDQNQDPHTVLNDLPDATINNVIARVTKNAFKHLVPFVLEK